MTDMPDPTSVPPHQSEEPASASNRPAPFIVRLIGEGAKLGPRKWLVEKIIEEKTLAVIYGPPHAGKSFLALDLACSVATGSPWLDRRTSGGKVLYVAGEGRNGLRYRLKAWESVQGKKAPVHELTDENFDFGDREHISRLITTVTELSNEDNVPTKLVIIDTLSDAIPGQDENAQAVMSQVVASCSRIMSETGATVVLVHHPSKANENELRGNSVLLCRADTTLLVKKRAGHRSVTIKKVREGKTDEEAIFRLNEIKLPDIKETSCVVELVKTDPTQTAWRATSSAGDAKHRSGGTHTDDHGLLTFLRGLAPAEAKYMRQSNGETHFPIPTADARKAACENFYMDQASEDTKRKRFDRTLDRLVRSGAILHEGATLHLPISDEDIPGGSSEHAA